MPYNGTAGLRTNYSGLKECGDHLQKVVGEAKESVEEATKAAIIAVDNTNQLAVHHKGLNDNLRDYRKAEEFFKENLEKKHTLKVKKVRRLLARDIPMGVVQEAHRRTEILTRAHRAFARAKRGEAPHSLKVDGEVLTPAAHNVWWAQLPEAVKLQWEALGWSQASWDRDLTVPASATQKWKKLSEEEKDSATRLGFKSESWNASIVSAAPGAHFGLVKLKDQALSPKNLDQDEDIIDESEMGDDLESAASPTSQTRARDQPSTQAEGGTLAVSAGDDAGDDDVAEIRYTDLGVGKCARNGDDLSSISLEIWKDGDDPAHIVKNGYSELECQQHCSKAAALCGGYSWNSAGWLDGASAWEEMELRSGGKRWGDGKSGCFIWLDAGLIGGGKSWGDAHCYVKAGARQAPFDPDLENAGDVERILPGSKHTSQSDEAPTSQVNSVSRGQTKVIKLKPGAKVAFTTQNTSVPTAERLGEEDEDVPATQASKNKEDGFGDEDDSGEQSPVGSPAGAARQESAEDDASDDFFNDKEVTPQSKAKHLAPSAEDGED